MAAQSAESHPEWTLLAHNQCPNCPLITEQVRYCGVDDIIEKMGPLLRQGL